MLVATLAVVEIAVIVILSVDGCLDQPTLYPASSARTHRELIPDGAERTEILIEIPDTTWALGQGPDPCNPSKPRAPHPIST
jgi:hypothetical protein